MLFLAHGTPLLDTPYALVGAALPDWLRQVRPRWRAPFAGLAREDHLGADEFAQLSAGLKLHVLQDVAFHRAPCFHQQVNGLTQLLRQGAGTGARRLFAQAHVLLELLLDAWLLGSTPGLAQRYREALRRVDETALALVLPRGGAMAAQALRRLRQPGALEQVLDDAWVAGRLAGLATALGGVGLPLPRALGAVRAARRRVARQAPRLLAPAWALPLAWTPDHDHAAAGRPPVTGAPPGRRGPPGQTGGGRRSPAWPNTA